MEKRDTRTHTKRGSERKKVYRGKPERDKHAGRQRDTEIQSVREEETT